MNKYDKTISKDIKQKDFIENVNKFHDNKYDYSLVKYYNNTTKVKIICPTHGIFEQSPKSHKIYGCNKCSGRKKLSINEFINKSIESHGNKYDYSLVDYKNSKSKVKIKCPIHGGFTQIPYEHYNGQGCPKCGHIQKAKSKTHTTEFFTERSILTHNNFYNYDKVKYTHNQKDVIITCAIHGDFKQKAINHLLGYGCTECYNYRRNNNKMGYNNFLGTEKFTEISTETHGNLYDYSQVEYKNSKKKVNIICKVHGIFKQTPSNHIRQKQGCPKCGNESKRVSNDEFILRANNIHQNKYTYISDYVKSSDKIKILCEHHGIFKQTPHAHLKGQGCPKCSNSKGELFIESILNKNNIKFIAQKKI